MKLPFAIACATSLSMLACSASHVDAKTWTDKTGKFSVEATLVEVRDGTVVLRRDDGREIRMPLAKLSEGDREFARQNQHRDLDDTTTDFLEKLNELLSDGIEPADNVGLKFWQSVGYKAIRDDIREAYLDKLGVANPSEHQQLAFLSWKDYTDSNSLTVVDNVNPLASRNKKAINGWLAVVKEPLDEIATSVQGDSFYLPLVNYPGEQGVDLASIDHVHTLRGVCRAFLLRTAIALANQEVDAAISDLIACYRLARFYRAGTTDVESMSAIDNERDIEYVLLKVLEAGLLNAQQTQSLKEQLKRLPSVARAAER